MVLNKCILPSICLYIAISKLNSSYYVTCSYNVIIIGSPGDPGQAGTPGEVGDRGPNGLKGIHGPPGPTGDSQCPKIIETEYRRHVRNLLDSSGLITQDYFNAWRGHQHPSQKHGEFILRQYVHDNNQEPSLISLYNFTEGLFNKSQFSIRRGLVLSVWTMNRKESFTKHEEYEK